MSLSRKQIRHWQAGGWEVRDCGLWPTLRSAILGRLGRRVQPAGRWSW
jgi:hypothetical protein